MKECIAVLGYRMGVLTAYIAVLYETFPLPLANGVLHSVLLPSSYGNAGRKSGGFFAAGMDCCPTMSWLHRVAGV